MRFEIDTLPGKPGYIRITLTTDAGENLSVDSHFRDARRIAQQIKDMADEAEEAAKNRA